MRRFRFPIFAAILVFSEAFLASCSVEREPATPVSTFKTYVRAFKQKDTTTMKLLLSSETIKMHEQQAKAEGVKLDEVIKRDAILGEGQTTVEYRNEKIEGERATVEYRNSDGSWETIPFVRENEEWKIDKKSFADRMIRDIEQNSQQFDEMLNRGRQPYGGP